MCIEKLLQEILGDAELESEHCSTTENGNVRYRLPPSNQNGGQQLKGVWISPDMNSFPTTAIYEHMLLIL